MRPHPFLLAWFAIGLVIFAHELGIVAAGCLLLGVFAGRLWGAGRWS